MDDGSLWLLKSVSKLGPLPVNYLVFDVESTGLDFNNDMVVQLGYAVVVNKELVECDYFIADWTHNRDKHFCDWLENRMEATKANMQARSTSAELMYKHSIARMKQHGVPVHEAFTNFMDIIKICKSHNFSLIAHNGLRFDQPMLNNNIKQVLGDHENFEFEKMGVNYFDTMAIERGLQSRISPFPDDNWASFTSRLVNEGGRIYSSLDRHCAKKYNLINKYNMSGSAHEADFDCKLTHYLFEEYRKMCEAAKSSIMKAVA
jgi:DNA polymerase III epsilon subunit-like protein